jgi:hypothetical protein
VQAQEQVQEREQDNKTFTRAAGWRSKSASGPTVSFTSLEPKTYFGARFPSQKPNAPTRGWPRRTTRVCAGSKSSSRSSRLLLLLLRLPLLLGLSQVPVLVLVAVAGLGLGLLPRHQRLRYWNSFYHHLPPPCFFFVFFLCRVRLNRA